MKGLHGLMYMAGDLRTPALANTNLVDIYSSEAKTRIVVMVADNGPIYSSTNSGMTWEVINSPGEYRFPLYDDANGGGFIAAATIHPSRENQTHHVSHLDWSPWQPYCQTYLCTALRASLSCRSWRC
jgi:hypothetical protein